MDGLQNVLKEVCPDASRHKGGTVLVKARERVNLFARIIVILSVTHMAFLEEGVALYPRPRK